MDKQLYSKDSVDTISSKSITSNVNCNENINDNKDSIKVNYDNTNNN